MKARPQIKLRKPRQPISYNFLSREKILPQAVHAAASELPSVYAELQ